MEDLALISLDSVSVAVSSEPLYLPSGRSRKEGLSVILKSKFLGEACPGDGFPNHEA